LGLRVAYGALRPKPQVKRAGELPTWGLPQFFKLETNMAQQHDASLSQLTSRQREIAGLLSRTGLSYKEVASKLSISEGTMRKHVENVYRRVGVHSRAELMIALSGQTI
jgi:DNA-binding NarL/FixJ family response regulator